MDPRGRVVMRWDVCPVVFKMITIFVNAKEKIVHRPTSDTRMTYKVYAQCELLVMRVMMLDGVVHATTTASGAATSLCGDYGAHDFVWHRPVRSGTSVSRATRARRSFTTRSRSTSRATPDLLADQVGIEPQALRPQSLSRRRLHHADS
jgi:hypothetical protein